MPFRKLGDYIPRQLNSALRIRRPEQGAEDVLSYTWFTVGCHIDISD